VDDPGKRGADTGAGEPVLYGDPAIVELGDLRLDAAQLALRLGPRLLIDSNDLEPDFAHARFRPSDPRLDFAALAQHARELAAGRIDPGLDDQPSVGELLRLPVFLPDELDLVDLGASLRLKSADF